MFRFIEKSTFCTFLYIKYISSVLRRMNVLLRRNVQLNLKFSIIRGKIREFSGLTNRFWTWTTRERPNWKTNVGEGLLAIIIFGITGSTSMFFVRPLLSQVGIEGSLVNGPNSYRAFSFACIVVTSPLYATMLLFYGTIFGRHIYFAKMSTKILRRFIPSRYMDLIVCNGAKLKHSSKSS